MDITYWRGMAGTWHGCWQKWQCHIVAGVNRPWVSIIGIEKKQFKMKFSHHNQFEEVSSISLLFLCSWFFNNHLLHLIFLFQDVVYVFLVKQWIMDMGDATLCFTEVNIMDAYMEESLLTSIWGVYCFWRFTLSGSRNYTETLYVRGVFMLTSSVRRKSGDHR